MASIIEVLPNELHFCYLSKLSFKSLLNCRRVCNNYCNMINDSTLWIKLIKRDFEVTTSHLFDKEKTSLYTYDLFRRVRGVLKKASDQYYTSHTINTLINFINTQCDNDNLEIVK